MVVKELKNDDLSLLWKEYSKVGSTTVRNRLIEAHLALVKRLAKGMMSKAFAKFVCYNEILAAGNFGLIQAVEGFELERGIRFETYATLRIRGAILDWLREIDWVPRLVRRNARLYEKAASQLRAESGQEPILQDVADYLHISLKKAHRLQQDARGADTYFQQESIQVSGEKDTYGSRPALDQIPDKKSSRLFNSLTAINDFGDLIACLTEREKIVLTLYYREDFIMKQISFVLERTVSCISRIHVKALLKIKDSFFL